MPSPSLSTWLRNPARRLPLLPLALVLLVLLLMRNLGNYPSVFADEWYYSSFARLMNLAEAPIPSYLYLGLFAGTSACGDGFLECARLLNALLFVGAMPFIYLIARRLMAPWAAALVALLSLMAPVNLFTAYFMPEAAYFFAFWVCSWLAMRFGAAPTPWRAVAVGAALGAMGLIKVHALFLAPPLAAFIVYVAFASRGDLAQRHWLITAIVWAGAAMATAGAVRFGLGYLMAGKPALSLLGSLYGSQSGLRPALSAMVWPTLQNLRGHILGLAILFGMPLAVLALHAVDSGARKAAQPRARELMVYTVLMLGALLAITAFFTATVAGGGPFETLERLHMRYYDFLFPLLLIMAGAELATPAQAGSWRRRLLVGLPLAAALVYGRMVLSTDFKPIVFDTPELWSLSADPLVFTFFTVLALAALACWVTGRARGAHAFLFVLTPLLVLASAASLFVSVRSAARPDAYIEAGRFARGYLHPRELDSMTIVGSNHAKVFKTKFFLDNRAANMLVLPEGEGFQLHQLGKYKDWVLVIGNHPAPPTMAPHSHHREFSLLRHVRKDQPAHAVDFTRYDLGNPGVKASGLAEVEHWGRWTSGKQLRLEFATALPRHFTLRLTGRAVGPNIGKPFTVQVGDQTRTGQFGLAYDTAALQFDTDGAARHISITVPQPIVAKTLGINPADERVIGLALIDMTVEQRTLPGLSQDKPPAR